MVSCSDLLNRDTHSEGSSDLLTELSYHNLEIWLFMVRCFSQYKEVNGSKRKTNFLHWLFLTWRARSRTKVWSNISFSSILFLPFLKCVSQQLISLSQKPVKLSLPFQKRIVVVWNKLSDYLKGKSSPRFHQRDFPVEFHASDFIFCQIKYFLCLI